MTPQGYMIAVFGIGVIFQAFRSVGFVIPKKDVPMILFYAGLSLLMLLPGKRENPAEYEFTMHILGVYGFFAIAFAVHLRSRILPFINEYALLLWNVLFLYMLCRIFGWEPLVIFGLPTLGTLILSFTRITIGRKWKIAAYIWYMCMVVTIACMQFAWSSINLFNEVDYRLIGYTAAFFSGIALFFLLAHIIYLIRLLPFPYDKHMTLTQRYDEWTGDLDLMVSKFNDHQMHMIEAVAIIVLCAGVLYLNDMFKLMPDWVLINIIIAVVPNVLALVADREPEIK